MALCPVELAWLRFGHATGSPDGGLGAEKPPAERLEALLAGIAEAGARLDKLAPPPKLQTSNGGSSRTAGPPVGHTEYSWSSTSLGGGIPVGHTAYSWGDGGGGGGGGDQRAQGHQANTPDASEGDAAAYELVMRHVGGSKSLRTLGPHAPTRTSEESAATRRELGWADATLASGAKAM